MHNMDNETQITCFGDLSDRFRELSAVILLIAALGLSVLGIKDRMWIRAHECDGHAGAVEKTDPNTNLIAQSSEWSGLEFVGPIKQAFYVNKNDSFLNVEGDACYDDSKLIEVEAYDN